MGIYLVVPKATKNLRGNSVDYKRLLEDYEVKLAEMVWLLREIEMHAHITIKSVDLEA
jgi:hypothetical protein